MKSVADMPSKDRAIPSSDRNSLALDLRLENAGQLFQTLDPAPFYDRDLDADAAEFIESTFADERGDRRWLLRVHLPVAEAHRAAHLIEAVHRYYERESRLARQRVRHHFRQARTVLLFALVFLGVCILARSVLLAAVDAPWTHVVGEGLLIVGWVAMWRPAELLLYDWIPLTQRARLLDRLSRVEIDIQPAGA